MSRMTGKRARESPEKWAIVTADVIAKWHSKTDFRSKMKTRA